MWLVIRSILFGFCVFLMMQGLLDITGVARSVPAVGAVIAGILSIANWPMIEGVTTMPDNSKSIQEIEDE